MTRQRIVNTKDLQHPAQNWQHEDTISEAYPEFLSEVIDLLTQFLFMWNGILVELASQSTGSNR